MKVYITNKQSSLKIPVKAMKALVAAVIAYEGKQYTEVGIHFIKPKAISDLHRLHFNDPSVTDCISFPIDNFFSDSFEGHNNLGDVFVCPEVAQEYALSHETDPYQETCLYVVHGLLHLMGYDDMEKRKKIAMRAAEKRHMKNLKQLGYF